MTFLRFLTIGFFIFECLAQYTYQPADYHANRKTPSAKLNPKYCSTNNSMFELCHFPYTIVENGFLILDFDQTLAGRLKFSLNSDVENELTIGFSESIFTLSPLGDALSQHPLNAPNYYPFKVSINPGIMQNSTDYSGAFRYAYLTSAKPISIDDLEANVELALAVDRSLPYPGNFKCSDDLLTDIWYMGVYTQEISTGGFRNGYRQFIDGGKRDRALWSADAWVQILTSLISNGDVEGAINTMETFANGQLDSGYIPHLVPVLGEEEKIALKLADQLTFTEYQCWFIIDLWEVYWHRGDLSWLGKMEPVVEKAMEWLYAKKTDDGMVDVAYGIGGFFGDGSSWHTPDATTGKVTHLNCLIYWAIEKYINIKETLGLEIDDKWRIWRKELYYSINGKLWDDEKKVFRNTENGFLHPENVVQDGNVIAVMSGLASDEQRISIFKYLEDNLHTEFGILTTDDEIKWPPSMYMFPFMSKYISPYYTFMELYARANSPDCTLDCYSKLLSMIKKCWGHMQEVSKHGGPTTFWEKISVDGGIEAYRQTNMPISYTSLAHGWSTGSVWLLSRILLGVKIVEPGFKKIILEPLMIDGIEWAEGGMPTPWGNLGVQWSKNAGEWTVNIDVPIGIEVDVRLPEGRDLIKDVGGSYTYKSK